jgi:23S rRNA (uracil1939-C5)-methyltransferase
MDVKIEKLIYGGEGLAHHDGATVFVPFVLPGEQVAIAPVEQKKKFVRARMDRVIAPSPERVAAPCPHFGVCGGCDYQHIPYEAQLKYKTDILRETLRRLGRIEWAGEISAHASPPWGYRNRAQWKVRPLRKGNAAADSSFLGGRSFSSDITPGISDGASAPEEISSSSTTEAEAGALETNESGSNRVPPNATDGPGGPRLAIGYYRANSTTLCAVETCEIISPLLLKAFLALRAAIAVDAFPRTLREIEAFTDASDSKLLLTATFAGFPPRAAELAAAFRETVPEIESLLFFDPTRERMELFGPGFIEYEACGAKYRVGHFSFFQVNRFLVDDLVRVAVDSGGTGRLALDLFAGVGLFAVALAKRFERVVAVESNPAAARDMEGNIHGGAIEVRAAEVESFLERYKEKPQLVLLDPPRAGLEPGAIKRLARIAPERITYVSCEPPTLARDLAGLREGGYDISEVHLFDLFPQTFHMEAVVRLQRRQ